MAVSNITRQSLIASLGYLDPSQGTTDSSASSAVDSLVLPDESNSSSSSSSQISPNTISQIGQLLSSLSQLQGKDPAAFKEASAGIASDFNQAASNLSDPLQRLTMESMAKQFSNASLTGSISGLNLSSMSGNLLKTYTTQNEMSLLDCYNTAQQDPDSSSSISGILSTNLASLLPSNVG